MDIKEITIKAGDFRGFVAEIIQAQGDTIINFGDKIIDGRTCAPCENSLVMGPEMMKNGDGPSFIVGLIAKLLSEEIGFITRKSPDELAIKWSLV